MRPVYEPQLHRHSTTNNALDFNKQVTTTKQKRPYNFVSLVARFGGVRRKGAGTYAMCSHASTIEM